MGFTPQKIRRQLRSPSERPIYSRSIQRMKGNRGPEPAMPQSSPNLVKKVVIDMVVHDGIPPWLTEAGRQGALRVEVVRATMS